LTFIYPSVKLRYPAGEFFYCHAAISDRMRHHDTVDLRALRALARGRFALNSKKEKEKA